MNQLLSRWGGYRCVGPGVIVHYRAAALTLRLSITFMKKHYLIIGGSGVVWIGRKFRVSDIFLEIQGFMFWVFQHDIQHEWSRGGTQAADSSALGARRNRLIQSKSCTIPTRFIQEWWIHDDSPAFYDSSSILKPSTLMARCLICSIHLEASHPNGTPKSSIFIHFLCGFSIRNHPAMGVPPFMDTPHVVLFQFQTLNVYGHAPHPSRCPGYALSTDLGPTNPRDKFAFVSDSALPAKPFSEIYQAWRMGSPWFPMVQPLGDEWWMGMIHSATLTFGLGWGVDRRFKFLVNL